MIYLIVGAVFIFVILVLAIIGIVGQAIERSAHFMDSSFRWGGGRDV